MWDWSTFDSLDDSGTPLPKNVVTISKQNTCAERTKTIIGFLGTPNADIHPNKGHDKIAKTLYKTYKDMQRDN